MNTSLAEQLHIKKGITSVIGSGGKSTLLFKLSLELSQHGSVILGTSTHIRPFSHCPLFLQGQQDSLKEIKKALDRSPLGIVTVATSCPNGKLTAPLSSFSDLSTIADYVLVEADGSKCLPIKAHAAHEPVIPEGSNQSICMVGAKGFFRPIKEVVHRTDIFLSLIQSDFPEVSKDSIVLPKYVSSVIHKEHLADRIFINQRDLLSEEEEKQIIHDFSSITSLPFLIGQLEKA